MNHLKTCGTCKQQAQQKNDTIIQSGLLCQRPELGCLHQRWIKIPYFSFLLHSWKNFRIWLCWWKIESKLTPRFVTVNLLDIPHGCLVLLLLLHCQTGPITRVSVLFECGSKTLLDFWLFTAEGREQSPGVLMFYYERKHNVVFQKGEIWTTQELTVAWSWVMCYFQKTIEHEVK